MNRRPNDILGLDNVWPRPGWVVLDAARDTQFTGQIAFDSSPPVDVYFDRGRAYLAERRTDPPIGALLVDNGALDAAQLVRGTVRAGEHEHLGRLFDLVPEVDRLLVLVTLELLTERLVAWVAGQSIRLATPTPYLMHPSGVHRWDSAEANAERMATTSVPAPKTEVVATVEAPAVVPDLDRLGDDMLIQWSEPAGARRVDAEAGTPVASGEPPGAGAGSVDDVAESPAPPLDLPLPDDPTIDRFEVVWPTGEVDRPADEEIAVGLQPTSDDEGASDVRVDVPDVADEVVLAVRQALAALEAEAVSARPSARQPAAPMFHYGGDGGGGSVATQVRPTGAVATTPPPPPPPPPGSDPLVTPPSPAIPGLVGTPPTLPPAVHPAPPPPDRRRSALRRLVDSLRGR